MLVRVLSNGMCPSGGVCDRVSMVCLVQNMLDGRKVDVEPRCPRYIDALAEAKLRLESQGRAL